MNKMCKTCCFLVISITRIFLIVSKKKKGKMIYQNFRNICVSKTDGETERKREKIKQF